jgi:hypothetical protein
MKTSLPIVLLLGLLVFFLVRKGELRFTHAVVVTLFGFLLASTAAAAPIGEVDSVIAGLLGADLHP